MSNGPGTSRLQRREGGRDSAATVAINERILISTFRRCPTPAERRIATSVWRPYRTGIFPEARSGARDRASAVRFKARKLERESNADAVTRTRQSPLTCPPPAEFRDSGSTKIFDVRSSARELAFRTLEMQARNGYRFPWMHAFT
jgi:hypothetical protein